MSTRDIPLMETQSSKEDLIRVPHPSHRHAAPSAPWPWIDLEDGLCVFFKKKKEQVFPSSWLYLQNFTAVDAICVAPPIPEPCDHTPGKCNRCWTGYPQSRFPNWTERQVRKAKIYDILHDYSRIKSCTCYRVDVNDCGLFTYPKEMIAVHHDGDEDKAWDDLVHEQVSF